MTPLIIIGTNLALIPAMALCLRWWLRGHPTPLKAQYQLCGILMWAGALINIAGAIISFAARPVVGLLFASTGLLMMTSMTFRRNQLARALNQQKNRAT